MSDNGVRFGKLTITHSVEEEGLVARVKRVDDDEHENEEGTTGCGQPLLDVMSLIVIILVMVLA